MNKEEALLLLFGISRPTLYKWKRDQRPIAMFVEKYLTHEEIVSFLRDGKVEKLEKAESVKTLKYFIQDVHELILDKIYQLDKKTDFLQKLVLEFNQVYSKYPNDVFDEWINFVLSYDFGEDKKIKEALLQFIYKVSIDTFYIYTQNINLLE